MRHARADSSAPGTDSTLWGAAEMLRHTFVSPFQRMATTKQTGPAPAAAASPAIAASPATAAAAAVAGIAVPHGEESPPCLPGDRLLPPRSPGQHMESAVATASWTGSTGSPATSIPLAQAAQAAQQQAQQQQHQPPPPQQAQQARHVQQTQQSPHAQQVQRAQQAQQAQQPNYGLLVEAQQRQLQQHRLGLGPLSEAGLAASSAADMVEVSPAGIELGCCTSPCTNAARNHALTHAVVSSASRVSCEVRGWMAKQGCMLGRAPHQPPSRVASFFNFFLAG